MAKDKLQKRKEALARQAEALQRWIKSWCVYSGYPASEKDEETQSVYDSNLVNGAYAARRDRHGNYLDHRFYKDEPASHRGMKERADPFEYALHCKIYSIEEMKEKIDWPSGETLYKIAYGTLAHKLKESTEPPYDINSITRILNFMTAGEKDPTSPYPN